MVVGPDYSQGVPPIGEENEAEKCSWRNPVISKRYEVARYVELNVETPEQVDAMWKRFEEILDTYNQLGYKPYGEVHCIELKDNKSIMLYQNLKLRLWKRIMNRLVRVMLG